MGLANTIRKGVAIANSATKDLQVEIIFYAWIGSDADGKPKYDTPIGILALVEEKQHNRRLGVGQEIFPKASLTILSPLTANGALGRHEPIDPRDKFILPNGSTGPILDVKGMIDPKTKLPYLHEVTLGWSTV
jgi:hypothetical protein